MKGIILSATLAVYCLSSFAQKAATVREFDKSYKTYPFSDPDPIPENSKIYPYFRFDGYAHTPVNKNWKVVELENDFIKVTILPEIGGKIWSAIEKSTGKSFIYDNKVVKFRDVAMRGPWTSGGIEANYGIVGHTPNCATPVDYVTIKKADGSVSCVIGVLDLLTRTTWRIDINLPVDKAYFTTSSHWYNASSFDQPYYTWMNAGLKAKGNLQFIYPGTQYIGHAGEYSSWPKDNEGRDLSYYENNNFGEYKSYHVFGSYTDFFGGYYHDDDFGMARYSTHDDKAGKKIWIWGLSQQGMIWEKLLTDNDGQYVEVQSGRLFNQPAEGSSFTPFKNRDFIPSTTDTWTEYWLPVIKTGGMVSANQFGTLNLDKKSNILHIYFSPVQSIEDDFVVMSGNKELIRKKVQLQTLKLFTDSIELHSNADSLTVLLGNRIIYKSTGTETLARPYASPSDFNWKSAQGLHLQGKEFIRQRMYVPAEEKLRAALKLDPYYLPALSDLSMLLYRQMKYEEALGYAKAALSIDTYDAAGNYYYGLINEQLNKYTDAKDGYDIATQSAEYRTAAFTRLAILYFRENNFQRSRYYAEKAVSSNAAAMDALQLLAMIHRLEKNRDTANATLAVIKEIDPLNHFSNFEKWLLDSSETNKNNFTGMIRNEMPDQTLLELAIWYYQAGRIEEAKKVLSFSRSDVETDCWKAFLSGTQPDLANKKPGLVSPFRQETAAILAELMKNNSHWMLKYLLGLMQWNANDPVEALKLLEACGSEPSFAPFYAVRAKLRMEKDSVNALADIEKAAVLEPKEWRYDRALINYYISTGQAQAAMKSAYSAYRKNTENYIIAMLYARVLMINEKYADADKLLKTIHVLPNEGSTAGRELYREAKLRLAAKQIKSGNCKKGLQYISESRMWPENLGSGKPYDEDIDERVEDWLQYQCLAKNSSVQAGAVLDKIIRFTESRSGKLQPSVKNLISGLAYSKKGRNNDGKKLLAEIRDKHPDNLVAAWTYSALETLNTPANEAVMKEDAYQLLHESGSLGR